MEISSKLLNNNLYIRNNVTLISYETKINNLIRSKSEEKKISILEDIKQHTDKILETESNKYDDAETELHKNQNHLNVIASGNFTLKDKIGYLHGIYLGKPLSEHDKTDKIIHSKILQTNVPDVDSKAPADIETMRILVSKATRILNARKEDLKNTMKECARRVDICKDAINFCDNKITYLQNQIRDRKNAKVRMENAGQRVTNQQPQSRKLPETPKKKETRAASQGSIKFADSGKFEVKEDYYGKYISDEGYKCYGEVINGVFVLNNHVEPDND